MHSADSAERKQTEARQQQCDRRARKSEDKAKTMVTTARRKRWRKDGEEQKRKGKREDDEEAEERRRSTGVEIGGEDFGLVAERLVVGDGGIQEILELEEVALHEGDV